MQILERDALCYTNSARLSPAAWVEPGEVFLARTELCSGPWLQSPQDRWTPRRSMDSPGSNPCVCAGVKGAKPGDLLAVDLLEVRPGELGYTGFAGWRNPLCQEIWPNDWDVVTRTVEIRDGFVRWDDRLALPVRPMVGTLATAPRQGEFPCSHQGRYGGNMDIQEVTGGATVYLPVEVEGALLQIGDVHAIMGDGEINRGGGIECRGEVLLRVRVLDRPPDFDWIRLEDRDYLMTAACTGDLRESFAQAARQLVLWMVQGFAFTPQEAYLLLGQVLESRCTAYVNPLYTVICKVKKEYLRPRQWGGKGAKGGTGQ